MGISPIAENTEIRSAYRNLSKLYHPDTTQLDRKEANDLFIRLQDSYEILSDSEKRRYYDWKLSLEVSRTLCRPFVLVRRRLWEGCTLQRRSCSSGGLGAGRVRRRSPLPPVRLARRRDSP